MTRKSWMVMAVVLVGLVAIAYGAARAQQSSAARPVANAPSCPCMQGAMGKGMMGGQMMRGEVMRRQAMGMGGGMQMRGRMNGMGPMIPADANIVVKDIDNGVTVTVTSSDARTARRIQLMADMMRDMHELRSLR